MSCIVAAVTCVCLYNTWELTVAHSAYELADAQSTYELADAHSAYKLADVLSAYELADAHSAYESTFSWEGNVWRLHASVSLSTIVRHYARGLRCTW